MDGTTASFVAAFDDLYRLAFRLAARITGDGPASEDVAAEALARAYARWDGIVDLPYRDAWVMRVASNLAIDVVRRRRDLRVIPLAHEFEDATALRLAVAAALAALPRRQREAVVLRYLAGYGVDEVAAALALSPNSVKTHLGRAAATLRVRLAGVSPFGDAHAVV